MKTLHFAATMPNNSRTIAKILSSLVDASASRIVTLDYISANGELKTINGRIGVKRYTKSGKAIANSALLTVYKMNAASRHGVGAHNFRTIRRDSIVTVRGMGAIVGRDSV